MTTRERFEQESGREVTAQRGISHGPLLPLGTLRLIHTAPIFARCGVACKSFGRLWKQRVGFYSSRWPTLSKAVQQQIMLLIQTGR